ncbi:phytase [Luteimonas yindakuii]|uniref:Phytase n=1 Tax=Luteimonas yindakuii TaxID=2565782 RepID=A0A4Z1R1L1_9GAMM|nr:phytase [Luteimonas yindakuii]TKS53392.1 phytase [Luteimonas yindakuii]
MTLPRLFVLVALLPLASACTGPHHGARGSTHPAPVVEPGHVVVAEAFITEGRRDDELDSLAAWVDGEGRTQVIATAKSTHRLVVFDGDSGARLGESGHRGRGAGQFERPNGIAVFADLVLVTERDAPRVQVLRLPGFAHLGSFGEQELRSPYGIWVHETAPGVLDAFVTDSFMYGVDHRELPPASELDQRVRRYRIGFDDTGMQATHLGAFGATRGRGVLHMVESIAGDPAHGRLLIADEDTRQASTLHEYAFNGRYTGRSLPAGTFTGEAEGVALWDCGLDAGYWLAVDQTLPQTGFHLFDRATLAPRGSFRGGITANTDGIALHAAATPRFPAGVLYAVHDDRALAAFDLAEVIRALDLDPACAH